MNSHMQTNSRLIIGYMILLMAWGMISCNKDVAYSHYEHTPISGWEKNDTLIFQIPPIAESGTYEEILGVRIQSNYPFLRLALVIDQTVFPKADHSHMDYICNLIDHDGTPLGNGISYLQYEFPIKELKLEKGDSVEIHIRHNMKREMMPSITDIGIKMKKK